MLLQTDQKARFGWFCLRFGLIGNRTGKGKVTQQAHPRNWGRRRRKEASVLYIYPNARPPMRQALTDYVVCVSSLLLQCVLGRIDFAR